MARGETGEIGRTGERALDHWATVARFDSSEPWPDILGVDRILRFALDSRESGKPLDQRHPGPHAWVQVKTSQVGARAFTVKLDTLRSFVFADSPVFIVLVQIDEQFDIKDAYIKHLDDALGGEVLRQLRLLGKDEEPEALHRETVSVRWSDEERVEPNGHSVRDRILEAIGDPSTYAERKKKWRDTVGYPEGRISLSVQMKDEDVIEHLLGRTPSIPATVPRVVEMRFGIEKLVHLDSEAGSISFGSKDGEHKAISGEPGTIRVKREKQRIDLHGLFWTVAFAFKWDGLAWTQPHARFVCGLIDIEMYRSGKVELSMSYKGALSQSLRQWQDSSNALKMLASGPCELWAKFVPERPLGFLCEADAFAQIVDTTWVDQAVEFADLIGLDDSTSVTGPELAAFADDRARFLHHVKSEQFEFRARKHPDDAAREPAKSEPSSTTLAIMRGRIGAHYALVWLRVGSIEVREASDEGVLVCTARVEEVSRFFVNSDLEQAISEFRGSLGAESERLGLSKTCLLESWESSVRTWAAAGDQRVKELTGDEHSSENIVDS